MTAPSYRISVVAQRVGLGENLLRMWERRYGFLAPTRSASGYRAYTDDDVRLLRRVKQLISQGMSIGDVARMAPVLKAELHLDGPGRTSQSSERSAARTSDPALELPLQSAAAWRSGLLLAAATTNQALAEKTLADACARVPPLEVYETVMVPVLRECGEQWSQGALSVAQEHLVTHAIRSRLLQLIDGLPPTDGPHVLCAGVPDDDHDIGLLGAALRARLAGHSVTYLGPRTPTADLIATAHALSPELVALSATLPVPAPRFLELLKTLRRGLPKRARLFLGGAGAKAHAEAARALGVGVSGLDPWPAPAAQRPQSEAG